MIALLAVAASTSAQLRQYLRVISIKLTQMYVPIVVLVLMFAPLRLFILNSWQMVLIIKAHCLW